MWLQVLALPKKMVATREIKRTNKQNEVGLLVDYVFCATIMQDKLYKWCNHASHSGTRFDSAIIYVQNFDRYRALFLLEERFKLLIVWDSYCSHTKESIIPFSDKELWKQKEHSFIDHTKLKNKTKQRFENRATKGWLINIVISCFTMKMWTYIFLLPTVIQGLCALHDTGSVMGLSIVPRTIPALHHLCRSRTVPLVYAIARSYSFKTYSVQKRFWQ